jgi:hypothetical protein
MIREYKSERAAFMREMRYGDTSDTYHIDRDGELSQMRTYAGDDAPRLCSCDYSTREICYRPTYECSECMAQDELMEQGQYDLDQELRDTGRQHERA